MHQKLISALAILMLIVAGLACSLGSSLLPSKRSLEWHLVLEIAVSETDREAKLSETIHILERRLDAAGLHSYQVQAQSATGKRILVDLPSVPDRERVKKLITVGGKLELVAVISPPSPAPVQVYDTKEEAAAAVKGRDPATVRILPDTERVVGGGDTTTGLSSLKWVAVSVPAIVDGSDLRTATAVPGRIRPEDYYVAFSLKPEGAVKFGAWTGANINNHLGVVLNDEVKSIAFIKGQILDSGEINGRFTRQSAEDLALVLQSGALPAPVKIVSETLDK
jgi:preprotein translocase subunit SecD